jgi:hypothetical protein
MKRGHVCEVQHRWPRRDPNCSSVWILCCHWFLHRLPHSGGDQCLGREAPAVDPDLATRCDPSEDVRSIARAAAGGSQVPSEKSGRELRTELRKSKPWALAMRGQGFIAWLAGQHAEMPPDRLHLITPNPQQEEVVSGSMSVLMPAHQLKGLCELAL